jgi:hypothetical protein
MSCAAAAAALAIWSSTARHPRNTGPSTT